MSEPKNTPIATPRPWRITVGGGTIIGPDIAEGVYPQIVCGGADRGDQELIVRAVNAHEQLTAALETLIDRIECHAKWAKDDVLRGYSCGTVKAIVEEYDRPEFSARQALDSARAALRAARGEK